MQDNIIERAEAVARELREFKAVTKATKELYKIRDGRATRVLEYLQIDEDQLKWAIDRADKDSDTAYTTLTSLL